MSDQLYPSDMTDREWEYIKDMIPAAKPGGRKRVTDMRQTLNAIFYLTRTGCAWRYLPLEYPPWQTVYGYFRKWRLDKTWQHIFEMVKRTDKMKGFEVLPRRWVVERTFARLSFNRRMSKDYELLPATSETFVYASMIKLMLGR